MSRVLVDSNVLNDVMVNDPVWGDWSQEQLTRVLAGGDAAINPIIYAELCRDYASIEALEAVLPTLFELPPV